MPHFLALQPAPRFVDPRFGGSFVFKSLDKITTGLVDGKCGCLAEKEMTSTLPETNSHWKIKKTIEEGLQARD